MGWDIGATGFRVVLVAEGRRRRRGAPRRGTSKAFLADHGLELDDVGRWVAHPGGPKVLEAMQRGARAAGRRARR